MFTEEIIRLPVCVSTWLLYSAIAVNAHSSPSNVTVHAFGSMDKQFDMWTNM